MRLSRGRLALQELDGRCLPAVMCPGLPDPIMVPMAHAGTPPVTHASHPLHGTGDGSYQGPAISVDAGVGFTVSGSVCLGSLGTFKVTGSVQGVGMIANGRAGGDWTLSNGHGTITLKLHGPTQPGFSPLPGELVYSITRGTGDFQHLTGYGTVALKQSPALGAPGSAPHGTIHWSFS